MECVIVTGASRGIGRHVATFLARGGHRVAAVARNMRALEDLSREHPGMIAALPADLKNPDDVASVIARADVALGGVSGLVSCAGVAKHRASSTLTAEDFDQQLAVNLRAPILLARDLAEHARARSQSASIVFAGSTLATQAAPETLLYAVAKGGLISATKALALEYARDGIRCNLVALGVVRTDMPLRARLTHDDTIPNMSGRPADGLFDSFARMHPLGRVGEPQEAAELMVQVLNNAWMTGSVVTFDGGLTAGFSK